MRHRIFIILLALASVAASAQDAVRFTIDGGLYNSRLQQRVEQTVTRLLTELNQAAASQRQPSLYDLPLTKEARESVLAKWELSPFRCERTAVGQKVLWRSSTREYEVRNIPLYLSGADVSDANRHQEVALTFNEAGTITSFQYVLAQVQYNEILQAAQAVEDLEQRYIVCDYVEQFRMAYNTKDIGYLEKVFSEDALIITGRVITVKPSRENNFISHKTLYRSQDKKTYLSNLRRVFTDNARIDVKFDDIEVMKHPNGYKFDKWYGVRLRQSYTGWSKNGTVYHDDGYVFLLWDFTTPDAPEIHVRTWQPSKDYQTGREISKDEVFSFKDVQIQGLRNPRR